MKKDKNLVLAAKMGELSSIMNHYNNSVEVYRRYLEKQNDPQEDQYIVEGVLECVERYMRVRGIDYKEMIEEYEIIEEFLNIRAAERGLGVDDYCKKFGLSYNSSSKINYEL